MRDASGWVILVHGGAKTIADDKRDANRAGCLAAVDAGAAVLRDGGSALDAAEAAIRVLEDDPVFNAGAGSVRNAAGEIEMDAALMDGATLDVGAVAAIRAIRNPIRAARALLREPAVLLVGEGAERFAAAHGLDSAAPAQPATDSGHDTVGCVVRDAQGHLAAATSTGGLAGTAPGRVGDSPLPGSGLYADDTVGAVSLSGDGESIIRTMLAARIMHALAERSPAAAATRSLDHLARVGGEAGAIVLGRDGAIGIAHNSDHFALAVAGGRIAPRTALRADELEDLFADD
jgi:beta-aspartyl-peptidase (threonine type)